MEIIAALIIACSNLTMDSGFASGVTSLKDQKTACIHRVAKCGRDSLNKLGQKGYQLETCSKEVY